MIDDLLSSIEYPESSIQYLEAYYTRFQVKRQVKLTTDYTDAVPRTVDGSIKI